MGTLGVRTTPEDEALLEALTARYSQSRSGITRFALGWLASHGPLRTYAAIDPEEREHLALHSPKAPDEGCRYCREEGWC